MDLSRRVAVVTGGASGIGASTVERLRAAGAVPVVWDVADCEVRCDVSDPQQVQAALQTTVEQYGPPTVLVAAAGVGARACPTVELPLADVSRTFAINTGGVLLAAQAVAAEMIRRELEGSIVVVSSANGTQADVGLAAYSMSKAAVNMLVRILARELGRSGIRINAVGPGPVATPMLAGLSTDPAFLAEVVQRTPLGAIGTPDVVAEAILNLLLSSWVTGQIVGVDGGSSLCTGRSDW